MIPVPMRHAMGLKGLEPFEEDKWFQKAIGNRVTIDNRLQIPANR